MANGDIEADYVDDVVAGEWACHDCRHKPSMMREW